MLVVCYLIVVGRGVGYWVVNMGYGVWLVGSGGNEFVCYGVWCIGNGVYVWFYLVVV